MARPSLSPGLPLTPLFLTWALSCLLLASSLCAVSAKSMPGKRKVPAMYVFGDSDVDVGNLPLLGDPGCAIPPYGQDYIPESGRCSNGKVSVDFLASYLGLPPVPPSATFPLFNKSPRRGLNFAFGGSGALPATKPGFDLLAQVSFFFQVLGANSSLAKTVPKSLFVIVTGANDYMAYLEADPKPNLRRYQRSIVSTMVTTIKALYAAGARRFVVANLATIGCYPVVIARTDLRDTACIRQPNRMAREYGAALARAIQMTLRPVVPGATILEMDYYKIFDTITTRFAAFGFKSTLGCCGAPLPTNGLVPCGGSGTVEGVEYNSTTCAKPNDYIYWDFTHPSQATASIVAKYVWDGNTTYMRPFNLRKLVSTR